VWGLRKSHTQTSKGSPLSLTPFPNTHTEPQPTCLRAAAHQQLMVQVFYIVPASGVLLCSDRPRQHKRPSFHTQRFPNARGMDSSAHTQSVSVCVAACRCVGLHQGHTQTRRCSSASSQAPKASPAQAGCGETTQQALAAGAAPATASRTPRMFWKPSSGVQQQ
jgi:hypothetical protein